MCKPEHNDDEDRKRHRGDADEEQAAVAARRSCLVARALLPLDASALAVAVQREEAIKILNGDLGGVHHAAARGALEQLLK